MQPVCQLDQHDLETGRSPRKYLPVHQLVKVLLVAEEIGDLGAAVNDEFDVAAEQFADTLNGHILDIFDRIMEKGSGQNFRVAHLHFLSQNPGNLARVQNIRLSALAFLAGMRLFGKVQGFKENPGTLPRVAQVPHHQLPVAGYIKFFLGHARGECFSLLIVI